MKIAHWPLASGAKDTVGKFESTVTLSLSHHFLPYYKSSFDTNSVDSP